MPRQISSAAMSSRATAYVIKATDSEALSHTIKRIEAFWLEIVTLPQE